MNTQTPLFDETGTHCLRPVQSNEEGLEVLQKLEAGSLKSCTLGDLLKIIYKVEMPLGTVVDLIGEARVVLDDTP